MMHLVSFGIGTAALELKKGSKVLREWTPLTKSERGKGER